MTAAYDSCFQKQNKNMIIRHQIDKQLFEIVLPNSIIQFIQHRFLLCKLF